MLQFTKFYNIISTHSSLCSSSCFASSSSSCCSFSSILPVRKFGTLTFSLRKGDTLGVLLNKMTYQQHKSQHQYQQYSHLHSHSHPYSYPYPYPYPYTQSRQQEQSQQQQPQSQSQLQQHYNFNNNNNNNNNNKKDNNNYSGSGSGSSSSSSQHEICAEFLKNGYCKYEKYCKYHHAVPYRAELFHKRSNQESLPRSSMSSRYANDFDERRGRNTRGEVPMTLSSDDSRYHSSYFIKNEDLERERRGVGKVEREENNDNSTRSTIDRNNIDDDDDENDNGDNNNYNSYNGYDSYNDYGDYMERRNKYNYNNENNYNKYSSSSSSSSHISRFHQEYHYNNHRAFPSSSSSSFSSSITSDRIKQIHNKFINHGNNKTTGNHQRSFMSSSIREERGVGGGGGRRRGRGKGRRERGGGRGGGIITSPFFTPHSLVSSSSSSFSSSLTNTQSRFFNNGGNSNGSNGSGYFSNDSKEKEINFFHEKFVRSPNDYNAINNDSDDTTTTTNNNNNKNFNHPDTSMSLLHVRRDRYVDYKKLKRLKDDSLKKKMLNEVHNFTNVQNKHEINRGIDENENTYSRDALVVDIDGTLVDINRRLQLAPGSRADGTRTPAEWNMVLSENYFHMDQCIETSRQYLKYICEQKKWHIVYLSGRRLAGLNETKKYLFQEWKFPEGLVIHRPMGVDSQSFKEHYLRLLSEKFTIVGYIGDRLIDDCVVPIRANIRPILVIPNEWVYARHIRNGLSSVVEEITQREFSEKRVTYNPEILEFIRSSKYWNMSYEDLIPMHFATEEYGNKYNVWPPTIAEQKKQKSKS